MEIDEVVNLQLSIYKNYEYEFSYKDCSISLFINTSGFPHYTITPENPNIHINTFLCSTLGTGNGKVLLCSSIAYLKQKFGYTGATEVNLSALSSLDMGMRVEQGKNKNLENIGVKDKNWEKHKKLVNYYRRYGFEIKAGYTERNQQMDEYGSYITPMIARLDSITKYCSAQPILPVFLGEISGWTCNNCSYENPPRSTFCKECKVRSPLKIERSDPELIWPIEVTKGGQRRRKTRRRKSRSSINIRYAR
jgi:hypothetical protein